MSGSNPISESAVATVVSTALASIAQAQDLAALKAVRQSTVGEQSEISQLNASLKSIDPEFKAAAGAVGEYNGKFMVNQQVLRGSSRFTTPGHARMTYRNFFPPGASWQRTGIRLAGFRQLPRPPANPVQANQ